MPTTTKRGRGRPRIHAYVNGRPPSYYNSDHRKEYYRQKMQDPAWRLKERVRRYYALHPQADVLATMHPCRVCREEAVSLVWRAKTGRLETRCLTHLLTLEEGYEREKDGTAFEIRYLLPGLIDDLPSTPEPSQKAPQSRAGRIGF